MTQNNEQLREEVRRLKQEIQREDDKRWDEVKANMALIPGIKAKVDALDVTINGSPDDAGKGVKVRLDRLEQTEKVRSWVFGGLTATTLALVLNTVWGKLTGKIP